MTVTSLFFLPTSSSETSAAQDLIYRLSSKYEHTTLPPWSLTHRLFRETQSPAQPSQPSANFDSLDKSKPTGQRFLQILALSHHAPRTYVAITTTIAPSQMRNGTPNPSLSQQSSETAGIGEPATIISIAAGGASEEFTQLITSKFGPLWQPRQGLLVTNGSTFEIGDFRVRVGELKQGYTGGTQMTRGAVCEIEWLGAEKNAKSKARTGEEDWEGAEPVIRGFWEGLEVRGAREVFLVPGLADGEASVRQWCEILRIRS